MSAMTKILVVDDDEVVRRSHLRSLCGIDCVTQGALNGADALQAMERDPFDVILLDLRMPGMDGMTVLKTIKEKWPESEVIVITGYPSIESAKEAVRLGAYNYIPKPVGPDEVIDAASNAVTHKRWSLRREQAAESSPAH
jgi:DNA-binding NtrC family response regulator